jgi:rSAM/selenodomain-associated transferase 2
VTAANKFSIIIPAWKDAENLSRLLPDLHGMDIDVIVVDAMANAETEAIVRANGAIYCRAPRPSRGEQMNLGAAIATGDVFIFHHADTQLTPQHLAELKSAFQEDPEIVGGAFYRRFDRRHPHLNFLGWAARILNRHGSTLYGDQSVFVRRATFTKLGGFDPIPLMEDVKFSRKLRRAGKIVVLDPPVESSARRHIRKGPWRTTILNGLFIVLYKLGVSPERLHRWYYKEQL